MNKLELIIVADWNDGDYITQVTEIKESELGMYSRILNLLKGRIPESGPYSLLDDTDADIMRGVLPHPYECGGCHIHTIESAEIREFKTVWTL